MRDGRCGTRWQARALLPGLIALASLLGLSMLAPAPAAAERELLRIPVPSKHIDPTTLNLHDRHPGEGPGDLMVNVLLPEDYNPNRQYPLLLLLHGGSGSADSWVVPGGGNIRETAKDLDAVIVMPDAAQSFYADWWNEGKREPGWEIWIREEVLPEIERRFSIRPERRFHAVAGLSMGGYGTWITAGTLPGYFGTAVPLSSFASTRGELAVVAFVVAAQGVPYETVYGPPGDFYAEGHDPVGLASNYAHTRLDIYTGDGEPDPETRPEDVGDNFSLALERELKLQNDEAVAAIEAAGSKTIDYTVHKGSHSWIYWRQDLQAAIAKGLFRPVAERPRQWTYKSSAARGKAWDLDFQRSPAPSDLAIFKRNGRNLNVSGSGRITLSDEKGCRISARLPLKWKIPAACRNLRVTVKSKLRKRKASRVTVTVKGKGPDGKVGPISKARVKIMGRTFRTNIRGKAKFKVRPRRAGKLRLVVRKAEYRPATRWLRVRHR